MKKLWFKAKDYGWGWYPATWQGWAVLVVWLVWFVGIVSRVNERTSPLWSLVTIGVSVLVLLVICWKTGERPSWRWAGKPMPWTVVMVKIITVVAIGMAVAGGLAFLMRR